jgi:hypothetical protein
VKFQGGFLETEAVYTAIRNSAHGEAWGSAGGLDLFGGNFFPTHMMAAISRYPGSAVGLLVVGLVVPLHGRHGEALFILDVVGVRAALGVPFTTPRRLVLGLAAPDALPPLPMTQCQPSATAWDAAVWQAELETLCPTARHMLRSLQLIMCASCLTRTSSGSGRAH